MPRKVGFALSTVLQAYNVRHEHVCEMEAPQPPPGGDGPGGDRPPAGKASAGASQQAVSVFGGGDAFTNFLMLVVVVLGLWKVRAR